MTMEKEITFQFKTSGDFWAFRVEALIHYISSDTSKLVLTCKCSDEHIELATKKYEAIIIVNKDLGT